MKESSKVRVHVYNSRRAFHVPKAFAREQGLEDRSNVVIVIRRGRVLVYRGEARLTSDFEVCSGEAVKELKQGEQITISFP
jgi:hypothetical protein